MLCVTTALTLEPNNNHLDATLSNLFFSFSEAGNGIMAARRCRGYSFRTNIHSAQTHRHGNLAASSSLSSTSQALSQQASIGEASTREASNSQASTLAATAEQAQTRKRRQQTSSIESLKVARVPRQRSRKNVKKRYKFAKKAVRLQEEANIHHDVVNIIRQSFAAVSPPGQR